MLLTFKLHYRLKLKLTLPNLNKQIHPKNLNALCDNLSLISIYLIQKKNYRQIDIVNT